MIEFSNSQGIKMSSPRLNDFRKSGLFLQSFNECEHYKITLCGCGIDYCLLGSW